MIATHAAPASTLSRANMAALSLLLNFPPLASSGTPTLDEVHAVADWLRLCRASWVQHPQFAYLQSLPDLVWLPFNDETWAEVMLVFRHKPGVEGRIHSFVVTDVRELKLAYEWATRTRIGEFVGVHPLPHDIACDPTQLLLYSSTLEGRAKGYHARMELKRLLPPKLRKLVSKHRRAKRRAKVEYLAMPLPCNGMLPFVVDHSSTSAGTHRIQNASTGAINDWIKAEGVTLPEWFTGRTKADLWVEELQAREPSHAAELAYWMGDARNFYLAVTGQVAPGDVEGLFVRLPKQVARGRVVQMVLFGEDEE